MSISSSLLALQVTTDFNFMYCEYAGKTKNKHRSLVARYWETSQFLVPTKDIYENVLQKTGFFNMPYDLVVDLTMGSCSTGVACMNTNRNFIGIELDENYFNISKKRVEEKRKEKDFNVVTSFGDEM